MSAATPAEETRLEELESRLSFQDDLVERLNDVVARQDRELVLLRERLRRLEAKLEEIGQSLGGPGGDSGHEVPPHY